MRSRPTLCLCLALTATTLSCGKDDNNGGAKGSSANLPLITPPVRLATPAGLQASLPLTSSIDGFRERFFNPAGGPTNIFTLLGTIDSAIDTVNKLTAAEDRPCRSQQPEAYTLAPAGQNVTFYGQCYQKLAADSGSATAPFMQYGVKDGITYIYTHGAAGQSATIVYPIAKAPGQYIVRSWITVGRGNAPLWDSGSYGIMNLTADSNLKTFEFAVAGVGLGYCGAQLKSDATLMFTETSIDMGETCLDVEDLCVSATDLTAAPSCTGPVQAFTLLPIGRKATTGVQAFGESQYPILEANVTLDGTPTDSVTFGPTSPTPGLGAL